MVLSHPDDTDPETWNQDEALDNMRKEFEGWDPTSVFPSNLKASSQCLLTVLAD